MQRTLAMIKPHANKHKEEIIAKIEKEFIILNQKEQTLTQEFISEFYAEHVGKGFFPNLKEAMMSGPTVGLILEAPNAILGWRAFIGATNPDVAKQEKPDSIRAKYGESVTLNAVHGSDSVVSSAREIGIWFKEPLQLEYTLAMIKPGTVEKHEEEIKREILNHGFTIIHEKKTQLSMTQAGEFYAEHKGKSFFNALAGYMTSGPVIAMALAKPCAIKSWRKLIGPTNKQKALDEAPNCIRARFGEDNTRNACHGSDSIPSALREIHFFFPEANVLNLFPHLSVSDACQFINTPVGVTLASDDKSLKKLLEEGLSELYHVKPANPMVWLGDWLLKHNPRVPSSNVTVTTKPVVSIASHSQTVSTEVKGAIQPVNKDMSVVFVFGGPGSGKGTQSSRIAKNFNFKHISIGDVLRAEVASGSERGNELQAIMSRGDLVSDGFVVEILIDALVNTPAKRFLIDGFPRTLKQMFLFEKLCGSGDFILNLECSDEAMKARLLARQEGRADDNEETINKRLETFHSQSKAILDFYGKLGKVRTINSEQDVEAVYSDVQDSFRAEMLYVLGAPQSGKSTISKSLAKQDYEVLNVDELVKKEIGSGGNLAEFFRSSIESSTPLAAEPAAELIARAMLDSTKHRFVLDGYPTCASQLEALEKELGAGRFAVLTDKKDVAFDSEVENFAAYTHRLKHYETETIPMIADLRRQGRIRDLTVEKCVEKSAEAAKCLITPEIIFVLGGPGSGKGTQCARLGALGYTHLSAGDLLRGEVARGSPQGNYINKLIAEGAIVPVEITLELLKKAMLASGSHKFLIDGFPRALDQAAAFEAQVGPCKGVLFYDVADEELTRRLLSRGKDSGRVDDNEDAIKKRLNVYHGQSMPVIEKYAAMDKVFHVDGSQTPDEVFAATIKHLQPQIVFVLGGPGSGKGTQCARIIERFTGWVHLSAGDQLRAAIRQGSSHGKAIQKHIEEGSLVPVEVTLALLQKAMTASGRSKFLIDGFPRAIDQAEAFEKGVGPCYSVLFFDCTEEEMRKRLLQRGETSGRADDNAAAIVKRFRTFVEQSLPVIDKYEEQDKVHKVDACRTPDEVFGDVVKIFSPPKVVLMDGDNESCEAVAKDARQNGWQHVCVEDIVKESGKSEVSPEECLDLLNTHLGERKFGRPLLLQGFPRTTVTGFPLMHDQIQALSNVVGRPKTLIQASETITPVVQHFMKQQNVVKSETGEKFWSVL